MKTVRAGLLWYVIAGIGWILQCEAQIPFFAGGAPPHADTDHLDGCLHPAVGVHKIKVIQVNRTHPEWVTRDLPCCPDEGFERRASPATTSRCSATRSCVLRVTIAVSTTSVGPPRSFGLAPWRRQRSSAGPGDALKAGEVAGPEA
jgi:hypothetical protein